MTYTSKSLRAFIGSMDFSISRKFYKDIGYEEHVIDPKMSYFIADKNLGFYLQDFYVEAWVENTMMFLEVDNLESCFKEICAKQLPLIYPGVKVTGIIKEDWGQEFHMLDPAGILWHFGSFKENKFESDLVKQFKIEKDTEKNGADNSI